MISLWPYFTGFVQSGFATRTKCWYLTFLQTSDSLTFCIYHTLPTIFTVLHVVCRSHYMFMTWSSYQNAEVMVVSKEASGQYPAAFVSTKAGVNFEYKEMLRFNIYVVCRDIHCRHHIWWLGWFCCSHIVCLPRSRHLLWRVPGTNNAQTRF